MVEIPDVSELFGGPIIAVDVGAANDLIGLGALGPFCEIHAVEPRSDAAVRPSAGAKVIHHNVGLAPRPGPHQLFITRGAEASSLRRPNKTVAERCGPDIFEVVGEATIDCITLAEFVAANSMPHIDFLKIDTQGTEIEILKSGPLDRISIIRTEAEFVEIYEGQALFDDIQRELSSRGFRFIEFTDEGLLDGKRIWADALFIRSDLSGPAALRAAAVLATLEQAGEAVWLLRDLGIDEAVISRISDLGAHHRSPLGRFIHYAMSINRSRRSAGKVAIDGPRLREIARKLSFGVLN